MITITISDIMTKHNFSRRILSGMAWRLKAFRNTASSFFGRSTEKQWARVVMDQATDEFVKSLDIATLSVLEISGTKWSDFGFASYHSAQFPEFDICEGQLGETYDMIIAEQVLEHVLWPYRAVRNMYEMLKPEGVLVVTTPFMIAIHNYPVDCSRWTEIGLKHLLAEGGFGMDEIMTGSWGNRSCIRANFRQWSMWNRYLHSLKNDPSFPVVIWAFASKTKRG